MFLFYFYLYFRNFIFSRLIRLLEFFQLNFNIEFFVLFFCFLFF